MSQNLHSIINHNFPSTVRHREIKHSIPSSGDPYQESILTSQKGNAGKGREKNGTCFTYGEHMNNGYNMSDLLCNYLTRQVHRTRLPKNVDAPQYRAHVAAVYDGLYEGPPNDQ